MSTWKRFDNLPKGLFLASLLLLGWLALLAIFVRWNALPDVAENLPLEETEAFWVANQELLGSGLEHLPEQAKQFMGMPISELSWIKERGMAFIGGQTVDFVTVNSRSQAESFLEGLKMEGEELKTERANNSLWSGVSCYTQGQPYCFTWVGELLFVSAEQDVLHTLQNVASGTVPNVESSANYQNVRGRLAQWNGAFYFVDITKIKVRFMDDFGALSSLLELFPATGGVIKWQAETWIAENFLAVDKNQLNGEAFYSPSAKYEQGLLPWTSEDYAWEWGGQDLAQQFLRIEEIFTKTSPATALIWSSSVENKFRQWLGEDFEQSQLEELLDGEQYFAFTPGEKFMFMTTLENDEEVRLAGGLKDRFINQGALWDPAVEVEVEHYRDTQVYHFTQGGEERVSMAFLPHVAIVSSEKAELLSTLDRVLGQAPERDLQDIEALLLGSDEIMILHCPLLPDGTILSTLWETCLQLSSSRKLFDDGTFTRTYFKP